MIRYTCWWRIRKTIENRVTIEFSSGSVAELHLNGIRRLKGNYYFQLGGILGGGDWYDGDHIVYLKPWLDIFPAVCTGWLAIMRYCFAPWKLVELVGCIRSADKQINTEEANTSSR